MSSIAIPSSVKYIAGANDREGTIVIEPCYPGFGVTLGNTVRRVLLSSLAGAAVTGVKIDGATHEFMSLPHIQEDILDIVLSLKKLRLKIDGEEDEVRLELSVHGEKTVTAGDFKADSRVTVVNKDLELAHITDMAGKLAIEITARRGRGYETIENRPKREKEIGLIDIDSFFSPVVAASVKIENTRVGKMTNWDKLAIDLETDGSISPVEAYEETMKILLDQFGSIAVVQGDEEPVIETPVEAGEEPVAIDASDTVAEAEESPAEDDDAKKKRGRPKKTV